MNKTGIETEEPPKKTKKERPDILSSYETYLVTHKQISSRSARDYGYAVGKFLKWTKTFDPTKAQAMEYYRYLQEQGYANSTIGNSVFALNHYFDFLGKNIRLKPPKRHQRQPTYLTVEEAQHLVRVIPNLRDRAIVMTLLYTGMRVNELCNLDMSDLHLDRQEITVRDTKNYHDRRVVISERCINALEEYLESLFGTEGEAVFISRKGGRISRGRVCAIVKKYGKLAGITKNVTPHVLRHTFATTMISRGASAIEVKDQLGHQCLESTLRYVHLQIDHRKRLYQEHCPQF